MAPITREENNGQTLVVSSTQLNDAMSIMFYRIEKVCPEYEIEIYSHVQRSTTEDILWLDYDSEYGCGDVHTSAFLQSDNGTEEALNSDGYYSDGSIIFHAQITHRQVQCVKTTNRLQLRISIPGLIINGGNSTLLLTETVLNEWQHIID